MDASNICETTHEWISQYESIWNLGRFSTFIICFNHKFKITCFNMRQDMAAFYIWHTTQKTHMYAYYSFMFYFYFHANNEYCYWHLHKSNARIWFNVISWQTVLHTNLQFVSHCYTISHLKDNQSKCRNDSSRLYSTHQGYAFHWDVLSRQICIQFLCNNCKIFFSERINIGHSQTQLHNRRASVPHLRAVWVHLSPTSIRSHQ